MYAIIEDGSHQFRVREGDHVRVDRRQGKAGDEVVFAKVLLIAGNPAGPTIGGPAVEVPGRRNDRRPVPDQEDHHSEVPSPQEHPAPPGHRQPYTTVRITIVGPGP